MSFKINSNIPSLVGQRVLGTRTQREASATKKLASGSRINNASDDATGLAISEKLRSKITGSRVATRNANDGISILQTAEGGFNAIGDILTRLKELSIQAANDTYSNTERSAADIEYQNLKWEIDRIAQNAEYNGNKLLNGAGSRYEIQIGLKNNSSEDRLIYEGDKIDVTTSSLFQVRDIYTNSNDSLKEELQSIDNNRNLASVEKAGQKEHLQKKYSENVRNASYSRGHYLNIRTKNGAQNSISTVESAIQKLNHNRAIIGSLHTRLGSVINSLEDSHYNSSNSHSRIKDADMAYEASERSKQAMMKRATTTTLSQANNMGQSAVSMLNKSL